ncbi:MAG: radical SAM protein, partial [Bacteroidota bacterium]
MKYSQFNSFQPFHDKMLAYNAFTDKYLLLEHMLYDMIDASMKRNDPMEINEVHPQFYDALIENGMIVEPEVDEIEKVRGLMESVNNVEDGYRLIINPTMNCNFKCWYCYETHIKDSRMEVDMVEKVSRFIRNLFETNKKIKYFNLSFFGGEPLLYYHKAVVPILVNANQAAKEYGVTL